MAIKHNYNIVEDMFIETYLKINDFTINSQIETDENGDNPIKSFICSASVVIMTMSQEKTLSTFNEVFIIPDIDTFNLSKAYDVINIKYPGEKI